MRDGALIYRTAIDGVFELLSSITAGFRDAIQEVSPVTQFVKKRYAREKHMTTERGESEISIGVLFKLRHDVIIDFDMGGITSAAEGRWYTTLAVI